MKKIMICGCGVQGSTIARKLQQEPTVEQIILADCSLEAAQELNQLVSKGIAVRVDASNVEEIVEAAQGCDLIINVMPLDFGVNVLEAAIRVKANYQDLAACEHVVESEDPKKSWIDGIEYMYREYGRRFAENGKTAIIGTGSAPGLMCVLARRAVRELDECDTINMLVYEGVEAKRFLPFWWSPLVALSDMREDGYAFQNGEHIRTAPFSGAIKRSWKEMNGKEVTLVEHAHDEPVYVGFNSEKYFKNCKNAYFKYGGIGVDFAIPIYRSGFLSKETEMIGGKPVIPFEFTLSHMPQAPKTPEEIEEILKEGLVADEGAFVCEVYGKKDGKNVMVDLHLIAPGMVEAFEKSKMSGEMYLTGQGAFLFTKLFLEDRITQKGLISSDMLEDEQIDRYLKWAEELDIHYSLETLEDAVCKDALL